MSQKLHKLSFCVARNSSISELLKKNLIGIRLSPMVFTNISGINITLPPKVLAPDAQLNLPVNITIITDCVCINCTHVASYCNCAIIVKWSSRYRLPNSWVFLCDNETY